MLEQIVRCIPFASHAREANQRGTPKPNHDTRGTRLTCQAPPAAGHASGRRSDRQGTADGHTRQAQVLAADCQLLAASRQLLANSSSQMSAASEPLAVGSGAIQFSGFKPSSKDMMS